MLTVAGMSRISGNDADLHHEDGSHRWTGGDGTPRGNATWEGRMRAHMADHKAGKDREPKPRNDGCGIPKQRARANVRAA